MKRILSRYLPGSILAIAIFSNVHAQQAGMSEKSFKLASFKFVEIPEVSADIVTVEPIAPELITERALKNFKKSFKESSLASWYQAKDGGYVAKFEKNQIQTRVNYDRKGNWTGTIRSYREKNLPKDVRHLVRSNYYDYTIFFVDEVTVGDKTAYLVKIEDAKTFMTIRVIDGEMDVYESYIKG
jgi:hypothetical protein